MRYEVKFRRYGVASNTVTSHVFSMSSASISEAEREVRNYYHIPSSTRVEILSVRPE